ncbi:MAG: hypothetical protein M3Q97_06490 [Bacteroidota bacterium]|nr:hypothetical protein [Bacteroidota bacterium]
MKALPLLLCVLPFWLSAQNEYRYAFSPIDADMNDHNNNLVNTGNTFSVSRGMISSDNCGSGVTYSVKAHNLCGWSEVDSFTPPDELNYAPLVLYSPTGVALKSVVDFNNCANDPDPLCVPWYRFRNFIIYDNCRDDFQARSYGTQLKMQIFLTRTKNIIYETHITVSDSIGQGFVNGTITYDLKYKGVFLSPGNTCFYQVQYQNCRTTGWATAGCTTRGCVDYGWFLGRYCKEYPTDPWVGYDPNNVLIGTGDFMVGQYYVIP